MSAQEAMDPVVREIPVHLADELRHNLYVHGRSLCSINVALQRPVLLP